MTRLLLCALVLATIAAPTAAAVPPVSDLTGNCVTIGTSIHITVNVNNCAKNYACALDSRQIIECGDA